MFFMRKALPVLKAYHRKVHHEGTPLTAAGNEEEKVESRISDDVKLLKEAGFKAIAKQYASMAGALQVIHTGEK